MKNYFLGFMLLMAVSMFSQDKLGTSKSQLNSKNSSSSKSSSSSSSDSYDGEDLSTIIEILLYVPVGVFKYGLIGITILRNILKMN